MISHKELGEYLMKKGCTPAKGYDFKKSTYYLVYGDYVLGSLKGNSGRYKNNGVHDKSKVQIYAVDSGFFTLDVISKLPEMNLEDFLRGNWIGAEEILRKCLRKKFHKV